MATQHNLYRAERTHALPSWGAFLDTSGQGMSGNGASALPSWDGTPVQYNNRSPNAYVVEHYSDGTAPGSLFAREISWLLAHQYRPSTFPAMGPSGTHGVIN